MDLWSNDVTLSPLYRHYMIGYTQQVGGICSSNQYSVLEYLGFSGIQNAAHELGHR